MKPSQSILRWRRNPSVYPWFPDNGLGLFTLDMGYPPLRASPGYLLAPTNETAKPVPRLNPRRPGNARCWFPPMANYIKAKLRKNSENTYAPTEKRLDLLSARKKRKLLSSISVVKTTGRVLAQSPCGLHPAFLSFLLGSQTPALKI